MRAAMLASTVGLLLLLLATVAASGPMENSYRGGLNVEEQLMMDYLQKVEGQHEEEAEDYEGEFSEERGEQPSEFYLQEVREQEAECLRPINHVDTIALKYETNQWLGCEGPHCANFDCPRLVMDADDWTICRGEVFRIYRMGSNDASDIINCGDIVAIYYLRRSKWFGCPGTYCQLSTCPGYPRSGFGNGYGISDAKFETCWGEVFTIYAYGKAVGEPITENDYIMLYYPRDRNWISFVSNEPYVHHETCPGTARPPGTDKYKNCMGEVLQIFKQ